MEIVLIVVALIVAIAVYSGMQKQHKIEAARKTYLESLSELKAAPTNANLKQHPCAGSRLFKSHARQKGHHRL
jgi:uncharacterized protein HemX